MFMRKIYDLEAKLRRMSESWASAENVLRERSGGTPDPDLAAKLLKEV